MRQEVTDIALVARLQRAGIVQRGTVAALVVTGANRPEINAIVGFPERSVRLEQEYAREAVVEACCRDRAAIADAAPVIGNEGTAVGIAEAADAGQELTVGDSVVLGRIIDQLELAAPGMVLKNLLRSLVEEECLVRILVIIPFVFLAKFVN